MATRIRIDALFLDDRCRPRAEVDPDLVREYAEWMAAGEAPPVLVYRAGERWYLVDGWHRVEAARLLGWTTIRAHVIYGGLRAGMLAACGANTAHGVRRSRADARRAVRTLLDDPEWSKRSDRWIAERCGVDLEVVERMRGEVT